MSKPSPITTLLSTLDPTTRRLTARLSCGLATSALLATLSPAIALAGDNSDVSYESIENSFVDDYSGGYSWNTNTITRDGVTGTIKIGHDIRGEPNFWDWNGSFFENGTNRKRYVSKMQEWATSDYLADKPDDAGMVATNFIAYNASSSENDVLTTKIWVNGVKIKEVSADYVSQELLEGLILSDFTDDTTIKFKFKYDPALTGSKDKSCEITLHQDPAVFARSIAVTINTGDWWTGDGAGCSIDYNQSWGGDMELRASWDDDVCLNAVGNQSSNNGTNINTYACSGVTESWYYGSDMKIHASWDPDMCVNMSGSNFWGGNVNLYDCDYAESFYFGDDNILHMLDDSDYCVNVYQSGVAWDENPTSQTGGAGVNIYHCDWVIDGWSRSEL